MTTGEIFKAIDRLTTMGTRVIMFSGGEPLLREDMGDIIRYCKGKSIFVGLTSNGDLVREKIKDIKDLDVLKLSFEGPPEIHDSLRGEGSYGSIMDAVKIAKENNMNIKFNTTLTKHNIDHIDYILQKAMDLDVKVKFNPVTYLHSLGKDISFLFPEGEKYRQTVQRLIDLKKSNPYIINSSVALKYLYNWPAYSRLKCYAGRLSCCITPNGDVYPCSLLRDRAKSFNCLLPEFKESFPELSREVSCDGCWCTSTLELNFFLAFNIDAVLNIKELV